MPWNGLVGQHMQGRVCLQSWPLLGPFGRLLADFLRYSYYNRTITVLSYENRTFPYYNRTTTLRTGETDMAAEFEHLGKLKQVVGEGIGLANHDDSSGPAICST